MRRIKVLLMLLAIVAGGSFAYGQTGPEDTYYKFDHAYAVGDAVAPYVGNGEDLIVQKAVVERATPAIYMQDTYNYGISESTTSANPHYMLTFHVEASTENPAHVLLFGNAYFNSSTPKDQKWAIYSAPCNPSIPSKNLVVEKINPENPSPSCYEFVLTAAGDFHLYWFENFTGDQKAEIYGLRVIYENNALYQSIRHSLAIEMSPSTTTADELTTSFFRLINATFDNTNGLNAQGRGIYFTPYAKGTIELEITSDIPSNSVHLYMDTVVTTQSAGRYTIYSPTNLQIDGTLTLNHTITRKVYKGGEYRISCDVNSTDNCYIRTIRFIPDYYTVTLNPNGGTVDPTELYYVPGISNPITAFPAPTKEGLDFDGWYSEGEGDEPSFPLTPTADITYNADWSMTFTLMSDGNIVHQESYIPIDETRTPDSQSCDANGRMFDYWTADQDVQIGGALVTAGTPIPDQTDVLMLRNTIFTAHWSNPHGQCGDNLTWEYDPSTTTLTIEGTGDMTDFGNLGSAPWNSYSANITSISLPEGLTHIGNNAFYGCNNKSLTSITIPSTVTSIGNYAFHHCSRLKTVNIPDGVTSIGNSAFANAAITSVAIPASVTSIGTNPFTAADLASITVDPNNPNYDSRGGCNAIIEKATNTLISGCMKTVIPDGVVAIGTCAFENASGLEYLSIPASVASFGDYAFNKCTDLYMMFILRKSPAVTLGTNVFGTQGVSMHLPTIISVHEEAYDAYWNSWTSKYPDYVLYEALKGNLCGPTLAWRFNSSNTLLIYGYGGAMFDYASSDDVPWLGDRADIKKIEFYLLSGNITHIGNYAFYECNNAALTSITIPNSVTTIGGSAFRDCSSLTSITIPSTVTTIGGSAFKNCTSLTSITIPSGVTVIGSYAFDECSNLASANIPDGVTLIDAGIFNGCSSLDAITIPSGVTEIKQYAFHNTALTTIDIPIGVTSIGYYAFLDCTHLADVTVHWDSPISPASTAFDGVTTSNVNLHVPYGTKSAYKAAAVWKDFNIVDPYSGQCGDNLTWEYDPATHTLTISGTGEMSFSSQPWTAYTMEIEKVVVESGVTSIGSNAFSGCTSLTSVTLPDGLTKIRQTAFRYCSSLASITIPNSVTDIGVDAFRGCSALTDIYVSWSYSQVPHPTNVFTDLTTSDIRLHFISVGLNDYDAYNTTPWSDMLFIPHGTCGANLTWELENNTLTITGSGAMEDYANQINAPWIHFINKSMCSRNYIGSIVLPNEVTSIGNNAFRECGNLTDIYVSWETGVPTPGTDAFLYFATGAELHVPCGTKSQYEAVAAWSSFTIDDPCAGNYPVTANGDPDNAGIYYSTFYYSTAKYLVPENVEAYAAAVSGTDLVLTKIADGGQTLPAATAVILKSTIDSYTMVPSDDAAVTITATNHLHGVDADTEISSVITSGSCYVLSYKSGYGVG
ncbi:MAG: leucine-rich repeat protein, partial [Paludibacteraceae bacterium]|nr:leucine-rich repeat protein [Paludibacteraceae bacterium]